MTDPALEVTVVGLADLVDWWTEAASEVQERPRRRQRRTSRPLTRMAPASVLQRGGDPPTGARRRQRLGSTEPAESHNEALRGGSAAASNTARRNPPVDLLRDRDLERLRPRLVPSRLWLGAPTPPARPILDVSPPREVGDDLRRPGTTLRADAQPATAAPRLRDTARRRDAKAAARSAHRHRSRNAAVPVPWPTHRYASHQPGVGVAGALGRRYRDRDVIGLAPSAERLERLTAWSVGERGDHVVLVQRLNATSSVLDREKRIRRPRRGAGGVHRKGRAPAARRHGRRRCRSLRFGDGCVALTQGQRRRGRAADEAQ